MRGSWLLLCLVLVPGTLAAAEPPPDPAAGKRLAVRWCSQCHVVADQPAKAADAGPPFPALAKDPAKTEDTLRGFLQHPQAPMPPLELSRRDINDLVAYIESLSRN